MFIFLVLENHLRLFFLYFLSSLLSFHCSQLKLESYRVASLTPVNTKCVRVLSALIDLNYADQPHLGQTRTHILSL